MSGLTNGTAYQFRVVARNSFGDSGISNVVTATPVVDNSIPVTWVDLVGVTANGNMITKTASNGWTNGGAASFQRITANGGVEFHAGQANMDVFCGLSASNPDAAYTTIQYAIYMAYNGHIYIYESGTLRGDFGTYTSADTLSVERTGTTIRYKKNGTVFYTSTVATSASLLVDAMLYQQNAAINAAKIRGVT